MNDQNRFEMLIFFLAFFFLPLSYANRQQINWMAVGNVEGVEGSSVVSWSIDGEVWSTLSQSSVPICPMSVTYSAKFRLWILVGQPGPSGSTIAFSKDGLSWMEVKDAESSFFSDGRGIGCSDSGCVGLGIAGQPGRNAICVTADGINWIGLTSTSIFDSKGLDAAYSGQLRRWVAGGEGSKNTLAYSDDLMQWNALGNTIFGAACIGVAWSDKQALFVAAGLGLNHIAYSANGISWTGLGQILDSPDSQYFRPCFGQDKWVLVADAQTNTILWSQDAKRWTGLGRSVFPNAGVSVAYSSVLDKWIAVGHEVGTGYYAGSDDGVTWVRQQASSWSRAQDIAVRSSYVEDTSDTIVSGCAVQRGCLSTPSNESWFFLEDETLRTFFVESKGALWAHSENWMSRNISHCCWCGIRCNVQGEVISVGIVSNMLQGRFPMILANLKKLGTLDLSENLIHGPIPDEIAKFSEVSVLKLSHNFLNGTLPAFANMVKLTQVSLSGNFLSGNICGVWENSTALQMLDLSSNRFSGRVIKLENYTTLSLLNLTENHFDGEFELGLNSLAVLLLGSNRFTGIRCLKGSFSLVALDLSSNVLTHVPNLSCAPFLASVSLENNLIRNISSPLFLPRSLKSIVLRNCSISGNLFDVLRVIEGASDNFPAFVDLGNNMLFVSNPWDCYMPTTVSLSGYVDCSGNVFRSALSMEYLTRSNSLVDYSSLHISCKQTLMPSQFPLRLDPSWFNFSECQCAEGYWGNGTICYPCELSETPWKDLKCANGGNLAGFRPGTYPAFFDGFSLAGMDPCRFFWKDGEWSPCNPDGTAVLSFMKGEKSETWCALGYEGRLCAKCSNGFFSHGLKCERCSSHSAFWPFIVSGFLCAAAILVFVVLPNVHVLVLWGEVVVFLLMLIIGGSTSWIFTLFGCMMLIQVALQIRDRFYESNGRTEERNLLISPSGFVKLFVFFIQTTFSVNGRFWESFAFIPEYLAFFTLNINGISCDPTIQSLFSSDISRFLMFMAIPALLFVGICVVFLLRFLFQQCYKKIKTDHPKSLEEMSLVSSLSEEEGGRRVYVIRSPNLVEKNFRMASAIVDAGLFLAYVSYFELVEKVLSIFRRSPESADLKYWMEELPWIEWSVSNSDFVNLLISACIFLVLYVIGIPAILTFLILRRRGEHSLGSFLWENYKSNRYWFELVWIARRLALAIVVASVPEGSSFVPLLILATLGGVLIFQLFAQPFLLNLENLFDALGVIVIVVTFGVNLVAEKIAEVSHVIPAGFYVVLLLNIGFVVSLCFVALWPVFQSCVILFKRRHIEVAPANGALEDENTVGLLVDDNSQVTNLENVKDTVQRLQEALEEEGAANAELSSQLANVREQYRDLVESHERESARYARLLKSIWSKDIRGRFQDYVQKRRLHLEETVDNLGREFRENLHGEIQRVILPQNLGSIQEKVDVDNEVEARMHNIDAAERLKALAFSSTDTIVGQYLKTFHSEFVKDLGALLELIDSVDHAKAVVLGEIKKLDNGKDEAEDVENVI